MTDDDDDEIDGDADDQEVSRVVDPRAVPARFHHLRAVGTTPAHGWLAFQKDSDETISKRLGSGVHAMAFGLPWAIWDRPAVYASGPKKGQPTGKISPRAETSEAWREFRAEHAGSVIMTPPEHRKSAAVVAALEASAHAMRMLRASNRHTEETILWRQCGRDRRSTPDLWKHDDELGRGFLAELKTTRCAAPGVFWRDVRRYSYHAQLADQRAAITHRTGKTPSECFIIAVETAPPYVVQVYRISDAILEEGDALCATWLDRLQVIENTKDWTLGYAPGIVDLEFPPPRE